MRPLRLELEGFGPYRARQAVDFSDVELFAITGPTGSGKTTLLDALAFALYGQVPRLGREVRRLRHPQAEVAWVNLVFAVGERVYRVERLLGRRNEARLFELQGEREAQLPAERLQELNARLEGLLGLRYNAFTRALLLPQGEFDRFLKGEASERRRILFQLFDLERLEELRRRAEARKAGLLAQRDQVEGELRALAWAEEGRRAALEEELARLEGEVRAKEKEREALEAQHQSLKEALEAAERRRKLEARLAGLQAQAPQMARFREALARAEEARRALPLWRAYLERREALARAQAERARLEAEIRAREEALAGLAYDPLAASRLREALAEGEVLRRLEGRARPPARPLAPKTPPAELLGALEEAEGALRALEAEAAFLEKASRLLEKEAELKEVERQGKEVRRRKEELEALLKAAQAHRLEGEIREAEELLAGLKARLGALEEALEALAHKERRQGVLAFRDLLVPGEACPLCGGVVHALPPAPVLEDLAGQRRGLEGERSDLLRRMGQLETRLGELRGARALLGEAQPGDPEALQADLQALEEELRRLRDRYAELKGERQALLADLAGRPRPEDPRAQLEGVQAQRRDLEARLQALGQEAWALLRARTQGRGVAAYLRGLQEELRAQEEAARRREALERELQGLRGALEAARAQEEGLMGRLEEAQRALAGLMPLEEAQASALGEEEVQRLQQALERYEAERARAEAELRLLPPPPAPPEELQARFQALGARLKALKEELTGLHRRLGGLLKEREDLHKALERRRVLEGEKARLERASALWEKLALDLRQDRFPAHLLTHHQEGLLFRANGLLAELSGGRYRLRAEGDQYLILDLWHEAYPRPVETLSGGETFLVSLALALALAEEVGRGRLGALFLDEGFGTLDPGSLEAVASVLESLPTRGRLVGVVTHVEALAERLPARLRVRPAPGGSRVEWD